MDNVESAQSYLLNVYDLTDGTTPVLINKKVTGTSYTLASGNLQATHIYKSVISSLCNDCSIGTLARTAETCPIVIEDIIMMTPACKDASCPCVGTAVPVVGGVFSVPDALQLYKVEMTCTSATGSKTYWFIIQTEFESTSGNFNVNIPICKEIGNPECPDCDNYSAPTREPQCNKLKGRLPDLYDVFINKTATGADISFSLPRGCSITVTQCDGCL
ncbi:MAG: hypothetical protein GC192_16200 [Bacteroidetes bacterium]|nr:hypothetical protein [Bacteroidota bacterium]